MYSPFEKRRKQANMDEVNIDVDPVYVKGTFGLYDVDTRFEEVKLDGHYGIKIIKHSESYCELDGNIRNQSVYHKGRVFYRSDSENIFNLINMFCEYTYKDLNGIQKCNSVPKVLVGGTICPTRKELFTYNSKFFVAFGRYIFGYNANYMTMQCEDTNDEEDVTDEEDYTDEDDVEEEEEEYESERWIQSEISNKKITLGVPIGGDYWENDYNYSFMIFDINTGILDAFGMYK